MDKQNPKAMPEYQEAKRLSAEIARREGLEDEQLPYKLALGTAVTQKVWFDKDSEDPVHPSEVRDLLKLWLKDPGAYWEHAAWLVAQIMGGSTADT